MLRNVSVNLRYTAKSTAALALDLSIPWPREPASYLCVVELPATAHQEADLRDSMECSTYVSPASLLVRWLMSINSDSLLSEHGFVENTQTALLVLAMTAFGWHAVFRFQEAARLPCVGAALFCLTCILREFDVEVLDLCWIVQTVASGTGRDAMMTLLWVLFVVFALLRWREFWHASRAFLATMPGRMCIVAGACLVTGSLYDRQILQTSRNLLWEELSELIGYALLCMAALTVSFGIRKARPWALAIRDLPASGSGVSSVDITGESKSGSSAAASPGVIDSRAYSMLSRASGDTTVGGHSSIKTGRLPAQVVVN